MTPRDLGIILAIAIAASYGVAMGVAMILEVGG